MSARPCGAALTRGSNLLERAVAGVVRRNPRHDRGDDDGSRRDAILEAVASVAERLLLAPQLGSAMDDVLRWLGEATSVDRVYVFDVHGDSELLACQRFEWAAPGVDPQIDSPSLQDVPFQAAGFQRWADLLEVGQPVYGDVEDFPEAEQQILRPQGIASIAVVPIVVGGHWWGFLGFDATGTQRSWSRLEIDALRAAAGVIGASIQQDRATEALRESESAFAEAYAREREAAERLRQLDEMKNTFLSALSHELRTPLTAILGFAETLATRRTQLTEAEIRQFDRRVLVKAEQLDRLLRDLLDIDRLTRDAMTVQRQPTALQQLAITTVEAIETNEHLVQVRGAETTASVDAAKTERIIENLVSNAIRHTPVGCHIDVWIDAEPDAVIIHVEDDGPGIPTGLQATIFEPFVQSDSAAHEASPGTGMGLTLVSRFAQLHGGTAWVTERKGGGASFHVRLPTTDPAVHAPTY